MAEPRNSRTPSAPRPRQSTSTAAASGPHTELQQELAARLGDSATVDFAAMSVVSGIHRAATDIRNHLERTVLGTDGLSNSAYAALFTLWVRGDQEARHLAQECGVSKGTLTGIVTTLEGRGLVARHAHESDGRLVVVSLTTKGRSTAKRLFPKFNKEETRLASALSSSEQRTLATLLAKLQATL